MKKAALVISIVALVLSVLNISLSVLTILTKKSYFNV